MKVFFVSALLIMGLIAGAQVNVSWVNYPGGVSVAADSSNNVYTANWDYNPAGDITITKRDDAGSILWEKGYNNTNNTLHEVATWVETDSEGNILVSGTIRSGYSNPVNASSLLMKFDPSGNLLWRKIYESDFDGSSTKKCLIDPEDNIYVLGLGSSGTGMVTKVKKFSPEGNPLWTYYDNAGIGAPVNFKFTPDNGLIITARAIYGSINGFAKINPEGNEIWSLPGVNSLSIGDAAGDYEGNSYIVTGDYSAAKSGGVVKKLSHDGALIWEKITTITGFRVEVGTDNHPVISGYPNSTTPGAAFMKFDNLGNMLWENLDADGPGMALLAHAQMKLDGMNAAYLAAGTMFEMAVCKVRSDGTSSWTATTSGSYAYAIDFGTGNSLFVVGGTTAKLTQQETTTSVNEFVLRDTKIFPNPAVNGFFNVDFPAGTKFPVNVQIYSASGALVFNEDFKEQSASIKTDDFTHGIYLLKIISSEGVASMKMIIGD
jgi:hypothetical protein